ncbi:MAG TPA: MFS transporter [Methanomassiliicoccales archaeon]|nr:MFS transporter [Methanomassiliicoccales archaeon]
MRWQRYHQTWFLLFLAWMFCYIDRSLTGPVVSWMITNQVGFFADAPMQHSLGGIIGAMFFAGYMLTQFPAGYLGDRFGRRALVVISTAWAGVTTMISATARSLTEFVALRVLTGLGEGAYYSNDRAIIDEVTPAHRKGLAMGVVFVGLALGLTIATVCTPPIMDWAAGLWGKETAWTVPFLVYSVPTLVVSYLLWHHLIRKEGRREGLRRPLLFLVAISAVLFLAIMGVFQATLDMGWSSLWQTVSVLLLAFILVAVIYLHLGMKSSAVLKDRNLVLMYISAIPILYTLWFFGFWALLLVAESSSLGLTGAAVYAGLFGLANVIGYPLGGWMCDRSYARGWGRKRTYVVLCTLVAIAVLILGWCVATGWGGMLSLGILLAFIGVLFAAMQTVHMTLTADLAPKEMMGQAFGMWNLVAEVGALLSPVLSGLLRDLTGDWTMATVLTGGMLLVSALTVLVVRENRNGKNALN